MGGEREAWGLGNDNAGVGQTEVVELLGDMTEFSPHSNSTVATQKPSSYPCGNRDAFGSSSKSQLTVTRTPGENAAWEQQLRTCRSSGAVPCIIKLLFCKLTFVLCVFREISRLFAILERRVSSSWANMAAWDLCRQSCSEHRPGMKQDVGDLQDLGREGQEDEPGGATSGRGSGGEDGTWLVAPGYFCQAMLRVGSNYPSNSGNEHLKSSRFLEHKGETGSWYTLGDCMKPYSNDFQS